MTPETIQLIQVIGFPATMLLGIGLGAWKMVKWVGPRIDMIVDRHASFLTRIESIQQTQVERLEHQARQIDEIHQVVVRPARAHE